MGIDVSWVTEGHEPKQEVFDPRQCLTSLATARWHTLNKTVCLRFIDPFGDTVFNQAQIPYLLAELEAELEQYVEPETKSHLQKTIRLVERAVDQMHTYIKF